MEGRHGWRSPPSRRSPDRRRDRGRRPASPAGSSTSRSQSDDEAGLLGGFCDRLAAAGVPLLRVATGSEAFHPTLDARGARWNRGSGVEREELHPRGGRGERGGVAAKPLLPARRDRRHRAAPAARGQLRAGRVPAARPVRARRRHDRLPRARGRATGPAPPWAWSPASSSPTRPTAGAASTDAELDLLRRLTRPFALAYKGIASVRTGRSLLETYLGRRPGAARARRGHRPRQGRAGRGRALVQRPAGLHPDRRHRPPGPGAGAAQPLRRLPRQHDRRARGRGAEVHRRRHPRHVPAGRGPALAPGRSTPPRPRCATSTS